MGTNYYITTEPPCPHCGRGGELRHIGKSSAGWVFHLRIYPDENIRTLDDWKAYWAEGRKITTEYGKEISPTEMLSIITERDRIGKGDFDAAWLRDNHAVQGPRGLARSDPNRHPYSVVPGEGTWDYCDYEFS